MIDHLAKYRSIRDCFERMEVSCTQQSTCVRSGAELASPAGIFRGARISSLPREEIRAPLKMPAGEARAESAPGKV